MADAGCRNADCLIRAGGSVFGGITGAACDKADAASGVGNTLRFGFGGAGGGPAATLEGFPAAESSGVTMASLRAGTLRPGNQGVVAW